MKMRAILGTAALVGAVGTALPPAQQARAATTISFWIRASDQSFTQPLVNAYNKSHSTQVKLAVIPNTTFVTKFGTAVAGGQAPDVIGIDLVYMPAFDAANQMTDITAMAHKLPFFNKLSPSHIRLATYQGKLYGLPFSAEGSILLYNKVLFRQAGLNPNEPPKTWAQIETDAKKVTALGHGVTGYYFPGACAGCNAFTMLPYAWADGGDILNATGTKATVSSWGALKQALSFYHRLWTEKLVSPGAKSDNGSTWFNGFQAGKVGMTGGGAFEISTLKAQYPKIDFGVTYIPGQNGGYSSFAGGDVIGVPRGSTHVTEAFDFINWCLSTPQQLTYFAKVGTVPVRTDLANNQYSKADPRFVIAATAMAHGRTIYSVHDNQLFNDQNGPWNTMLQKAFFTGQIDQAVATGQQQFTQILSSSNG
jgi:multiple sugar transport system substrate-binding protein